MPIERLKGISVGKSSDAKINNSQPGVKGEHISDKEGKEFEEVLKKDFIKYKKGLKELENKKDLPTDWIFKNINYEEVKEDINNFVEKTKKAEKIYVFGTGGSQNSPQALTQMLKHAEGRNEKEVIYIGDLNESKLNKAVKDLEENPHNAVLIYSLSGNSQEPIFAAGLNKLKNNPVFVATGSKEGKAYKWAQENDNFDVIMLNRRIGGRFTQFNKAALSLAAAIGIDTKKLVTSVNKYRQQHLTDHDSLGNVLASWSNYGLEKIKNNCGIYTNGIFNKLKTALVSFGAALGLVKHNPSKILGARHFHIGDLPGIYNGVFPSYRQQSGESLFKETQGKFIIPQEFINGNTLDWHSWGEGGHALAKQGLLMTTSYRAISNPSDLTAQTGPYKGYTLSEISEGYNFNTNQKEAFKNGALGLTVHYDPKNIDSVVNLLVAHNFSILGQARHLGIEVGLELQQPSIESAKTASRQ